MEAKLTKLSADHEDLVKRLSETKDHTQKDRPPVSGGAGNAVTDC